MVGDPSDDTPLPVKVVVVCLNKPKKGERFSFAAQVRCDRAIRIFNETLGEGQPCFLVLSGGETTPGNVEAHLARQYLLEEGVPEGWIVLEDISRSTRENVEQVAALLAGHPAFAGKKLELRFIFSVVKMGRLRFHVRRLLGNNPLWAVSKASFISVWDVGLLALGEVLAEPFYRLYTLLDPEETGFVARRFLAISRNA